MTQKTEIKRDHEPSVLLFTAFGLSFRFLSRIYLEIPSKKFIEEIVKNKLFFEWPVAEDQKTVSKGLKILQDYSCRWRPPLIEGLKQDYTRLFIGLEKTLAPPYASVYLSEDHLLYEKPVLEVRQFYKRMGLYVNPQKKEPDDHIGFELFCLSLLCENAAGAANQNDRQKYDRYQGALSEFFSGHLNPWLDSFLSQVLDKTQTSFYRGVAILTLGLVESLSAVLKS